MSGYATKTPSVEIEDNGGGGGVQAEATIYFVVWWVLFKHGRFDHFLKRLTLRRLF